MDNFKSKFRGYDKKQVDKYIEKLKHDYETSLKEQKDRIFILKDEVEKLKNSNQNELMGEIVSTLEKVKILEQSAKFIYESQIKNLQGIYDLLSERLQDRKVIKNREVKDELLGYVKDCQTQLKDNIEQSEEKSKNSVDKFVEDKNNQNESTGKYDAINELLTKMIGANNNAVRTEKRILDNATEKKLNQPSSKQEPVKIVRKDSSKKKETPKIVKTNDVPVENKEEEVVKPEKKVVVRVVKQKAKQPETPVEAEKTELQSNDGPELVAVDTVEKQPVEDVKVAPAKQLSEDIEPVQKEVVKTKPKKITPKSTAKDIDTNDEEDDDSFVSQAPSLIKPNALGTCDEFLNDEGKTSKTSKNFEDIMFKKKQKSVITAKLAYPEPNESGFDLKEAVNPTDDLNEIMKSFDFFDGDDVK